MYRWIVCRAVAHDDWRVSATFEEEGGGLHLFRKLPEVQVAGDVRDRLGDRLSVSREGHTVFVYADAEGPAREAERILRDEVAESGHEAVIEVTRWHPVERRWEDPTVRRPDLRGGPGGRGGHPRGGRRRRLRAPGAPPVGGPPGAARRGRGRGPGRAARRARACRSPATTATCWPARSTRRTPRPWPPVSRRRPRRAARSTSSPAASWPGRPGPQPLRHLRRPRGLSPRGCPRRAAPSGGSAGGDNPGLLPLGGAGRGLPAPRRLCVTPAPSFGSRPIGMGASANWPSPADSGW